MNYKAIFNALASGDMEIAKSIASRIGGRQEIKKEHDHPLDFCLGYTLRAFVLGKNEDMKPWALEFATVCSCTANNVDFQGYAQVFQAILGDKADLVKRRPEGNRQGAFQAEQGTGSL